MSQDQRTNYDLRARQMGYSFQRFKYLIVLLLSALGVSAITSAASASAGSTTPLAYSKPDRLVASTGNLYWTSDSDGLVVARAVAKPSTGLTGIPYTGHVWRASKSNIPGQEIQLYSETQNYPVDFEAITWALVGGQYYGYFVANYPSLGVSQIKRLPLAGGAAVILATSPAQIGARDLVNDGAYLYWADAAGIRKVAIGGGPVTTLVSGTTFTHLGLDSSLVYYTSGQDVMSVAKTGGSPAVFGAVASTITALSVLPPDPSFIDQSMTSVLVGEANGSVSEWSQGLPQPSTVQAPSPGVSISSVLVAGFSDATAGSDLNVVANGHVLAWGYCNAVGCGVAGQASGINAGFGHASQQFGWAATSAAPIDVSVDGRGAYWGDRYLEKGSL